MMIRHQHLVPIKSEIREDIRYTEQETKQKVLIFKKGQFCYPADSTLGEKEVTQVYAQFFRKPVLMHFCMLHSMTNERRYQSYKIYAWTSATACILYTTQSIVAP